MRFACSAREDARLSFQQMTKAQDALQMPINVLLKFIREDVILMNDFFRTLRSGLFLQAFEKAGCK